MDTTRKFKAVAAAAGLTSCIALLVAAGHASERTLSCLEDMDCVAIMASAENVIEPSTSTRLYTEEDVQVLAKVVYGEALVTRSDMEMAAVVWCILNRVDSGDPFYPESIIEVATQEKQFHGYSPDHPVDQHIEWLVRDVLDRWAAEKNGAEDVGRVLPADYLFFWGDGRQNHFTQEYHKGAEWDWSLPNPYQS